MIALINIVLTLVSLGKDVLLAGYLGTSSQADSFLLAYFIIDTVGNNLLAAALGVSIIPVLAGLQANGKHPQIIKLTRYIVTISLGITTMLALLMFGIRSELLSLLGAGLNDISRELSIDLFRVLIPSLVLFPLISIGISILQVRNRFNIPAFAPVLYNVVLFIGLIFLRNLNIPLVSGVYSLAFFTIAGVLTMLAWVWFPIIRWNSRELREPKLCHTYKVESYTSSTLLLSKASEADKQESLSANVMAVGKSFLPYLLTILFPQLIYMVERYFASQLESGSIAGLNYAFRLVQFPLWVFVAAVSTVLFPVMAKTFSLGQKDKFNEILSDSIFNTLVLTLPLTIILFVLRVPIVSILLQRGEFSSYSVAITTNIMAGYTFTIIWQGFSVILVRAALVSGRVRIALFGAALSAVATLGFDFKFVPIIGAVCLGFGATLGAVVNFATLFLLFSRYWDLQFKHGIRLLKILFANLPLFFLTLLFSQLWGHIEKTGIVYYRFGYALLVILVCLPVYWFSLKVLRVTLYEKQ